MKLVNLIVSVRQTKVTVVLFGTFTMESDILTEIPLDKYSEVLDTLRKDWPNSMHIYYLMVNFRKWSSKIDGIEFKVYCPENNTQLGVFVTQANIKTSNFNSMSLHCSDETGLKKMEQILRETSIIDWNKKITFEATREHVVPLLEAIAERKHLKYDYMAFHKLWLPPEKSKQIILEDLPDGLELRDLEEQHADIINRTWAYKGSDTLDSVKTIINLNGGIGLFLKGSDSPIAWNTVLYFYALGMLYTLDDYRQKSYGSLVTKALSKKLVEDGIDPFAYVKDDNVPSFRMFNKLGFEKLNMIYWGNIEPKTMTVE